VKALFVAVIALGFASRTSVHLISLVSSSHSQNVVEELQAAIPAVLCRFA
jgi:hypothetical protein